MFSGGQRTKGIIKKSQENLPLITVITVVRNGEETLEETILSVINQTYTNIEYIIIDGASTDGTLGIIKKYEEKIDYWTSEPDYGIYDAMNKGILLSTGEWINFMNSGDSFYSLQVINEILLYFVKNIDIIYGNRYIDYKKSKKSCSKLSDLYFILGGMICHQAIFARKELFHIKYFDTTYKIYADKDWLIYLFINNFTFKYIPYIFCNYDSHGISSNNNNNKEHFIIIKKYYGTIAYLLAIIKNLCGKFIRTIKYINS